MVLFQGLRKLPNHIYLSIGIFLFIFVFPLIDRTSVFDFFGPLAYSIMSLSILSIVEKKRKKTRPQFLYVLISLSIVFLWLMYYFDYKIIRILSFAFNIFVFSSATIIMIAQIVASKEVNSKVIIEVINGYLLIGVMFTLTNSLLFALNHNSFSMGNTELANLVYYSFITLTTIGYGDILPMTGTAKMASIFFGLSGQLYLTIIVALIIGKFLNNNNSK